MASYNTDLQSPAPPVLPPKPNSHETSRIATPASAAPPHDVGQRLPSQVAPPPPSIPDPGDQWLPQMLQDKSKQDLAEMLASPALLHAIAHAPQTRHASLAASHQALATALAENVELATHLTDLEARLAVQRAQTQAQLLATHAQERQWRQKQSDMDHALAPFSPAALYQRLGQAVQEQAMVCQAMEESFLEGEEGVAERDVTEWVRRYREAKVQLYLRQERKERWDEGRVGGWR